MNMRVQGVSSFFTTGHMANVPRAEHGGQEAFAAIRKENPAPLSPRAKQLMEVRGLQDPVASTGMKGIDTYA